MPSSPWWKPFRRSGRDVSDVDGRGGRKSDRGRSCVQSVRIARRNAMRVNARAAARPWRHLGLPTPKRVRMSKARLSPAMCSDEQRSRSPRVEGRRSDSASRALLPRRGGRWDPRPRLWRTRRGCTSSRQHHSIASVAASAAILSTPSSPRPRVVAKRREAPGHVQLVDIASIYWFRQIDHFSLHGESRRLNPYNAHPKFQLVS